MNLTFMNNTKSTPVEKDEEEDLPIDMKFNQGHLLSIIVYSILFLIAAVGNITLLGTIIRIHTRSRLGRVNLFLLHLAIADLMVTFVLMPLEIGWAATVYWTAGDLACRFLSFFRTFGLYLSGFLLVCISFDRYFAVLKPMTLPEANHRGRMMLSAAWIGSILCSLPQVLIFHVERHPKFKWYEQCVTFNFFPSKGYEVAYSVFGFIFMYGFPLVMIIFCYTCEDIRRSNIGTLGRAKVRTLKMTVVIVCTFCFCWTPYNIMSLWYWIDSTSAQKVDQRIQKGLFLFAVTNSCFNPIVYGLFHIRRNIPPGTSTVQNGNRVPNIVTNGRQAYKFRVRWKSQGPCVCSTHSCTSSSSNPIRPMYELNGVPHYLNRNGNTLRPPTTTRSNYASKMEGGGSGGRSVRNPRHPPSKYHRHHPTHNVISKKLSTFSPGDSSDQEEVLMCSMVKNNHKKEFTPNGQHINANSPSSQFNSSQRPLTTQSFINVELDTSPIPTTSYFNHIDLQTTYNCATEEKQAEY